MATVDEIAPDIFRISLGAMPGDPITTSFFLIRDEQPTLVETGYRKTFDAAWDAVSRLLDPTTLRYVVVPHLEGDESGALNHFLERAPAAQAVGSPIGAAVNLSDFAIREPLAVDDSTEFDLGHTACVSSSRPTFTSGTRCSPTTRRPERCSAPTSSSLSERARP
jgi:flavorubredoxin